MRAVPQQHEQPSTYKAPRRKLKMSGLKNLLREANGIPTGGKFRNTRTQNSLLFVRNRGSKEQYDPYFDAEP